MDQPHKQQPEEGQDAEVDPGLQEQQDGGEEGGERPGTSHGLTWEDIKFLLAMFVVSVGFTLRGGPMPGAIWASLKGLGVCYFYGVGTAFLFVGVAKAVAKIMNRQFTYDARRFLRWVFALAALFAVSQFFHEGYLVVTGQLPAGPAAPGK